MNDDLVQRLRDPRQRRTTLHHDAADELDAKDAQIARLRAANQEWLDKWERLNCEWCGTANSLGRPKSGDVKDTEIEQLRAALIRISKSAAFTEVCAEAERLTAVEEQLRCALLLMAHDLEPAGDHGFVVAAYIAVAGIGPADET